VLLLVLLPLPWQKISWILKLIFAVGCLYKKKKNFSLFWSDQYCAAEFVSSASIDVHRGG
jgi:hypothetical protein